MFAETYSFQDWFKETFHEIPFKPRQIINYPPELMARILQYHERLFRDPVFVLDRFDEETLKKAFWEIPSVDGELGGLCRDDVPWQIRVECIQSIFDLFTHLFRLERAAFLDRECFMWWEHFQALQWNPRNESEPTLRNIPHLVDEVLGLLERLLAVDLRRIQMSALHGFNEFYFQDARAERIEKAIDDYLERNPSLDKGLRDYARRCRTGDEQ